MIPEEYYLNSRLMVRPVFGQPYEDVVLRTTVCEEHPIHMHDCTEIVYVIRGLFECRMAFERYEVREGEFMVFNAYEVHRLRALVPDSVLSCIHISRERLPVSEGFLVWWADILKRNEKHFARQAKNLRLLIRQYEERADEGLLRDTLETIIQLFRTRFRVEGIRMSEDHEEVGGSEIDLSRASDIYLYLYRHCDEKLTLDDLAGEFLLSKYYLSHFMKRISGGTIQEFLTAARCDRAEIALLDSSRTLEDIRIAFGFSSNQYFNENFKRWYGMTPGTYRRTYQKQTVFSRPFAEHPAQDIPALLCEEESLPQEETVVELHIRGGACRISFLEYRDGEEVVTGFDLKGADRITIESNTGEGILIIKKQ